MDQSAASEQEETQLVKAEKRKTRKIKHSKTKKTITSKLSMQTIQTEKIEHEHVDHITHTTSTEPQMISNEKLQSSRILFDSLPENTTTELHTDYSAIEQKAHSVHHALYPCHEVNASQFGNEIGSIELQECKSHAVIDTLLPLNISEANLTESAEPSKFVKMPSATHISASIIAAQSLITDEAITNDTYDELCVAEHARSVTAKLEYVPVEAKMVDERYVHENETEWTSKMPAMQRERADVSVITVNPIEVQMRNVEENISQLPHNFPVISGSIDVEISDQKSLNVTEIVCEQETSPFRSEPLPAGATAATDFELHRPYNVEETLLSEMENTIQLLTAADESRAEVSVTCMDSVKIGQTIANEFETDLVVGKPETATAANLFKPYQTMQTNVIECYDTNESLQDFKYELSHAEMEMNDYNVQFTETVNVYQSEKELKKSKRQPELKQATPTFVTMKSSMTEEMIPNELESQLRLDTAIAEHATRAAEQAKVVEISSVLPLESVEADIKAQTVGDKQNAQISFELQKSAIVNLLVNSNEKESDLIEHDLLVRPFGRHDVVQNNPIESIIIESLDSECIIESELTQLQQSKMVPGHPLALSSVNVVEPCDAVDSIEDRVETNKNARVITDSLYGLSAYSILPTEQTTDGLDTAKPNYKFASANLLCQNAIEISTQSTVEAFTQMEIDSSKGEQHQILPKPSDSLLQSANIFETRALENVGDISTLDHSNHLKMAGTHFDEHNQVNVSETVPFEQIVQQDSSVTLPSTTQATQEFTQQTAASVSMVTLHDSSSDLTHHLPGLIQPKFAFDTIAPLSVQVDICQEETAQIHTTDEHKLHRPISAFVPRIANERMEIDLLENSDILQLNKWETSVGTTTITNVLLAPQVGDILIHGSEHALDIEDKKPFALAKTTTDNFIAYETLESVILEQTDWKKESETDSQAPSASMQETFSHNVYTHNVFEKESGFETGNKPEHKMVKLVSEKPLKSANVMMNTQLHSVEQMSSGQTHRSKQIASQTTKQLMSSAAEETTVIFECEDYKDADSHVNLNTATVSVTPQHHVTVEANETNDSAMQFIGELKSNQNKCNVTSEPCLPVTANETVITSELSENRKQAQAKYKKANLSVNEIFQVNAHETIANIDYRIPSEVANVCSERELLHGVENIEIDFFEKENSLRNAAREKLSQNATILDHTGHNLIKQIQTNQRKINIHIENEYYNEQKSREIHAVHQGKLACI